MSNAASPSQTYRVSPALALAIFNRDKHTCMYCGATGVKLNVDHVRPASWFPKGTDRAVVCAPSNLVAACERCNSGDKGALSLEAYAMKLACLGMSAKAVRAMVARIRRAVRKPLAGR